MLVLAMQFSRGEREDAGPDGRRCLDALRARRQRTQRTEEEKGGRVRSESIRRQNLRLIDGG
jgi:hypothetical protein